MKRFQVDVKAFVSVPVWADDENAARIVADAFVECAMEQTESEVAGYVAGLDSDVMGKPVVCVIGPAVDGSSEVEERDEDGEPI